MSNDAMPSRDALPYPDADLRAHPPRNPREQLGGLVFLPRTIDKVRAKLQGTLGFYKVGPGLSSRLFEWIGISEEDFTQAVRDATSDDDIAEYIRTHCDTTTFAEINQRLIERGIRDDEQFAEVLPRYPVLRDYPQLRNWFEILEVDDRWSFDPANATPQPLRVEILTFAGCPNAQLARERTADALAAEGATADVVVTMVETPAAAIAHRFTGSPSVRVNGRDVAPGPGNGYGLMCRTYRAGTTVEGAPSVDEIRNAIRSAAAR